jgi:hypothetical protein
MIGSTMRHSSEMVSSRASGASRRSSRLEQSLVGLSPVAERRLEVDVELDPLSPSSARVLGLHVDDAVG